MKAISTPVKAPRKRASSTAAVPATPAKPTTKASRKRAAAPEPVRRYHHGNLRDELVRCGKSQLQTVGLADLSLRQIASEVGVSQVAPKHHFGNKEGLLAAMAASGFRDLTAFRTAKLTPKGKAADAKAAPKGKTAAAADSEQRLRLLLSSYVLFATQHPALFHLMFSPQFKSTEPYPEFDEAAAESYQVMNEAAADFLSTLKGGKSEGIAADEAARIAWMAMHGVATLLADRRSNQLGTIKTSRDQLINRTLDVVIAGIRSLATGK